jgi:hypothetical protein
MLACAGAGSWFLFWRIMRLVAFVGMLALALLLVALAPKPFRVIGDEIERHPLVAALWGLAAMVLVVPAAVVLAVSIVGIVLIPVELVAVTCALAAGYIGVAGLAGRRMAAALRKPELNTVPATLAGLLVFWLVGWIPVAGAIVTVIVLMVGLGGVAMTLYRTGRDRKLPKEDRAAAPANELQ